MNFRAAGKDSGLNSDRDNSGGEQLYIAPGLTAPLGEHFSAYAIAQVPLYRRVNGYQLSPKFTVSLGLLYRI